MSIFSKIIARQIPAEIIYEDERFIAFLDIMPLCEGHTLVVPKKETDCFFDMDNEELQHILIFAKKVSDALRKTIPCKRIGLSVIGLEVPHAHLHLAPISSADDLNFSRPKLNFTPQELAETAEKIRKNL
ncbi:MAG: HIT family protein [Candidatus Nephrothrix sp. EaCA]|nr:MAG: HIT family protein [Candidatus Nephrothrix sp. EaCA]